MSRIGKKPIMVPSSVKVEKSGQTLKVSGPLGSLQMDVHPQINVEIDASGGQILVQNPRPQNRRAKQLHGTARALLSNMVNGVGKGFERKLEIYGTGYNVKEQDGKLVLQVGFCRPVQLPIPKGTKVTIEVAATRGNDVPAKFTITSMDKRAMGQFAADIRKVKSPEPYKGKGIRYADEHIKHKVGKAFASGTA